MDRRWIFLGVALCTILPFFMPFGRPIVVTPYTQEMYDEVEKTLPADDPESKPILLSMDYDPGTLAEVGPMAKAVLRHIFAKKAKVIVITFLPTGAALARQTLFDIAGEFDGIKEGDHFAWLGFNTPVAIVIKSMGRDIRDNYPTDHRGIPLDDIPLFAGVKNYDDIHLIVSLAGNNIPVTYISQAVERFGANFAMGVTNVMAADFTPYIESGQSKGMLTGMRGAAEYERLIVDSKYWPVPGDATRGMDSQSVTHFFIILLIVLGNLGYFLGRRSGGDR